MFAVLSIAVLVALGWLSRRAIGGFERLIAGSLERLADKFRKAPTFDFICPHCLGPVRLIVEARIYQPKKGLRYSCPSCHRNLVYVYELAALVVVERPISS